MMYAEDFAAVAAAARLKLEFQRKNPLGFFISSMLAGAYVGLAILLALVIGGQLSGLPYAKIVMGIFFGGALALVVMAGAELFTGSNLVLSAGLLGRTVSPGGACKLWVLCLLGNWAGAILVASAFFGAGVATGAAGEFIAATSAVKMSYTPHTLLLRGMLCNIFVCLGTWCSYRMKSESGKLIMIFWCLFAFLVSGYEHGIANMTVLTVGMLAPFGAAVSWSGYFYNIFVASAGNFLGGALCVALPYFLISRAKK